MNKLLIEVEKIGDANFTLKFTLVYNKNEPNLILLTYKLKIISKV